MLVFLSVQASSANGMSAAALLGQRQSSLLERSDMTPEEMAEAKGKTTDYLQHTFFWSVHIVSH